MYKFNGKGNVILIANNKINIDGEEYLKGDIITSFKGVNVSLISNDSSKEANVGSKRLVASTNSTSTLFRITDARHEEEFNKLLFTKGYSGPSERIKIQTEVNATGTIFLNVESDSLVEVRGFSNGEKVEGVVDYEKATFTVDKRYDILEIFITERREFQEFSLKSPKIGSVKIYANVEGTLNEDISNLTLEIESAVMVSTQEFVMGDSYTYPIDFLLINNSEPIIKYEL